MNTHEPIRINVVVERAADPLLYDWLSQFSARARAEQLASVAHDGALMRSKWWRGEGQSAFVGTSDEEAERLARRQAAIEMSDPDD